MRLAVLLSSGKDSCYAMYKALKMGHEVVCLITIESSNKSSYMFHTPNVSLASYQAEALGLPLIKAKTKGEKEEELVDLKEAIVKAREKFNIDGVVTGALFSKYQWNRVDRICNDLELMGLAPLWEMDQEKLLGELLENKFEIIISSIACDGLTKSWLGRKLDSKAVEELVMLNKKIGINVAGEGGEYESLVLDCPMFKKKLVVEEASQEMESENVGIYDIKKVKLVDKD